jgi:tetratricopeptide (TPR) repeat protein
VGKAQKPAKQTRKPDGSAVKNIGVWQIISVVAVLALLSYLVYMQIGGEKSPVPPAGPAGNAQGMSPLSGIGIQPVDLKPLEDAVRARPSDAGAQLMLANALHDNRMLPRAVEAYGKYLTMRPKDPDARTDLGICYFQMAQADSLNRESLLHHAVSAMEEAFNSAPRPHQPSAFNLGVVYLHLSELEESNKWFRKAVEINRESDLGKRAQNMITQHAVPQ